MPQITFVNRVRIRMFHASFCVSKLVQYPSQPPFNQISIEILSNQYGTHFDAQDLMTQSHIFWFLHQTNMSGRIKYNMRQKEEKKIVQHCGKDESAMRDGKNYFSTVRTSKSNVILWKKVLKIICTLLLGHHSSSPTSHEKLKAT